MIAQVVILGSCAALALAGQQDSGSPAPPVTAIAISNDGRFVVAASQAGVRRLTWPELDPAGTLDVDYANVHDLAFSTDGSRLAVAGGDPAERGGVIVFSWPQAQPVFRRDDHTDVVYCAQWRADGKRWLSAGLDQVVRLYRDDGTLLHTIEGHSRGVKSACFLGEGELIVTGGIDQNLRVWDAGSAEPIRALNNHTAAIHAMAVRPLAGASPMLVSVSDDRTIRLWQPTIGRMVRFVRLRRAVPLDVAWTPDGAAIVAVSDDGQLSVIDPDLATVKASYPAIDGWAYCVAVHPGGREAAVGGAGGKIVRVEFRPGGND